MTADDLEVYHEEAFDWEPDDAELTDDDLSGAEDLAEAVVAEHWLLDAPNLVGGSYVLPNSNFLPLPRQNYEYEESGWVLREAGMLACSSPSPQRDQGAAAEPVSLQHWNDDTGQHRCKIEAFLPGSTQSDMGRLTPVIQGDADLPGPFATVDRAGDLVAAGSPDGDTLVWQLRSDSAEGMHLVGHFSVDDEVCSVRSGMWLGARRLIATCLAGQVLLLDAPGREMPLTAEDMFLSGANLNMEVCTVFVSQKLIQIERGDPHTTAVLLPSKFIKAVGATPPDSEMSPEFFGIATSSPNGQWMAICSSRPEVLMLSADNEEPPFQYAASSQPGDDMEADCTWDAGWDASGSLVAVISNALTRLTVYSMKTRQLVLWVHHVQRLCQAVAWHPHDEHLLVFAETSLAVHILDVRFPYKHQQLLWAGAQPSLLSITGLCISPDSRLWVATKAGVQAFQLLCLGSNDTHKHWPRLFKAVVRELLVGWQARHTREGAPQPVADTDAALLKTLQHLHGLPLSVLMNIFQLMA